MSRFASSPDIPTANGPCRLIRPTTSRFTCPVRTIRTTSIASGVVTRSPAANVLWMPSWPRCSLICGPAAVHHHRAQPAYRRNTTSCANATHSSSSVMACPPNLITTVSPWNRSSQGSASIRVAALASAPACSRLAGAQHLPGGQRPGGTEACCGRAWGVVTWSMPSSRARTAAVRSVVRIVAACGPADRSTVMRTSRGRRSTPARSSAAERRSGRPRRR